MVCHRAKLHVLLYAAMILYPADEVASCAGAEHIHDDGHYPHSERGWHNEIFGS